MSTRGLGGNDPLERPRRLPRVIPDTTGLEPTAPAPAAAPAAAGGDPDGVPERRTPAPAKRTKAIPRDKRQVTAYIDAEVVDAARNAVLALMANPAGHRTLSALVEEGIRREVARLSEELYDGAPFPVRQVELQAGRPGGV